jgi:hypothetical protein
MIQKQNLAAEYLLKNEKIRQFELQYKCVIVTDEANIFKLVKTIPPCTNWAAQL